MFANSFLLQSLPNYIFKTECEKNRCFDQFSDSDPQIWETTNRFIIEKDQFVVLKTTNWFFFVISEDFKSQNSVKSTIS